MRDQFLFHNPNKAYFVHSLEHVEKYVERTAVAQAAYSLAVDTRLDKHLDSGDRVSLGRAAVCRVPGLYLHSSGFECAPRTPRRLPSALETALETAGFDTDEGAALVTALESRSAQQQRKPQPQPVQRGIVERDADPRRDPVTDRRRRLRADAQQHAALEAALQQNPKLLDEMRAVVPGLFDF